MMPYQSYQIYQTERTKTYAEIRRTDEQLGHMAKSVSRLWHHATRPVALHRDSDERPVCPALLDVAR